MYKLYFFNPNGKLVYVPFNSLEEAQEEKINLPMEYYFGIGIPTGEIVEPAPDYDYPIQIINYLKKMIESTK